MRTAENARGVVIAALRHMARGLWTGALSFGLVNIPVEVHTAVRETRPHFRLLHAKDRSPINYERVCQKDGDAVAWDDLVKGYEYEKGRFVVLTKADFTAAALEKTRRIDILDFVEAAAIDDRFFDKPYYLTPGKGGDAAYGQQRTTQDGARGSPANVTYGPCSNERRATTSRVTRSLPVDERPRVPTMVSPVITRSSVPVNSV